MLARLCIKPSIRPPSFSSSFLVSPLTMQSHVIVMVGDARELDASFPSFWVHPKERAFCQQAHSKRQVEFLAGRSLLRECIMACYKEESGDLEDVRRILDESPILPSPQSHEPSLPLSMPCSLSHKNKVILAAVASSKDIQSLGVDIETIKTVSESHPSNTERVWEDSRWLRRCAFVEFNPETPGTRSARLLLQGSSLQGLVSRPHPSHS